MELSALFQVTLVQLVIFRAATGRPTYPGSPMIRWYSLFSVHLINHRFGQSLRFSP